MAESRTTSAVPGPNAGRPAAGLPTTAGTRTARSAPSQSAGPSRPRCRPCGTDRPTTSPLFVPDGRPVTRPHSWPLPISRVLRLSFAMLTMVSTSALIVVPVSSARWRLAAREHDRPRCAVADDDRRLFSKRRRQRHAEPGARFCGGAALLRESRYSKRRQRDRDCKDPSRELHTITLSAAPAAMPRRGTGSYPSRGISVRTRRGWGPGASEKVDRR